MTLHTIPVESTTLATLAYDPVEQLLQLQFRAGEIYQYRGVPLLVYHSLLQATSKGKHFHQTIRGRFPYVLISAS